MGGMLDAIIQREQERKAARSSAFRRKVDHEDPHIRGLARQADKEHRFSAAGIRDNLHLDDHGLSESDDEQFASERLKPNMERIDPADRTLSHGFVTEGVYAEGGLVREDVDLTHLVVLDILLRDAPHNWATEAERYGLDNEPEDYMNPEQELVERESEVELELAEAY